MKFRVTLAAQFQYEMEANSKEEAEEFAKKNAGNRSAFLGKLWSGSPLVSVDKVTSAVVAPPTGKDAPLNCIGCGAEIRKYLQPDEVWYPCSTCNGKRCERCCEVFSTPD